MSEVEVAQNISEWPKLDSDITNDVFVVDDDGDLDFLMDLSYTPPVGYKFHYKYWGQGDNPHNGLFIVIDLYDEIVDDGSGDVVTDYRTILVKKVKDE